MEKRKEKLREEGIEGKGKRRKGREKEGKKKRRRVSHGGACLYFILWRSWAGKDGLMTMMMI